MTSVKVQSAKIIPTVGHNKVRNLNAIVIFQTNGRDVRTEMPPPPYNVFETFIFICYDTDNGVL